MPEKLQLVDADTLLSTPMEKTLFIVEGLIPQGVSMLCGSGKIGKSWLMLWLGIRVAQGLPLWELPTHQSMCSVFVWRTHEYVFETDCISSRMKRRPDFALLRCAASLAVGWKNRLSMR